jgi:hypothetical protein
MGKEACGLDVLLDWAGHPWSRCAAKQAEDAQVFIKVRPADALSITKQFPFLPLLGRGMQEAGKPRQRHANTTPVNQLDYQLVTCNLDVMGSRIGTSR